MELENLLTPEALQVHGLACFVSVWIYVITLLQLLEKTISADLPGDTQCLSLIFKEYQR